MKNRIVKVEIVLSEAGTWECAVTKEFAPENGGGSQRFVEDGGREIHYALGVARGMVAVSAGQRTDL